MVAARHCSLGLLLLTAASSIGQQARPDTNETPAVMFHAQTRLVLLSFHVFHANRYVTDLKPADIILLEDGKPRAFAIFDSPATHGRMPLELVLLFDTNKKIDYFWDPADVFRFIPGWDDAMSRAVLEKETSDVRVSVYRCAGQRLYRLISATTDSGLLTAALRGLLTPRLEVHGESSDTLLLSLPPLRNHVGPGAFTNDFPTSYFVSAEQRGWPMEAAIGTLNDVAAAQDQVSRVLVMFSEGIGATTTRPEDVGDEALDLGIPIYPMATNYQGHIRSAYPRNLFRMQQFENLGEMTGGQSAEYTAIDAVTLKNILQGVKNAGLSQYVVGFVPASDGAKVKAHKLEIKLASKASGSLSGGKRTASY